MCDRGCESCYLNQEYLNFLHKVFDFLVNVDLFRGLGIRSKSKELDAPFFRGNRSFLVPLRKRGFRSFLVPILQKERSFLLRSFCVPF